MLSPIFSICMQTEKVLYISRVCFLHYFFQKHCFLHVLWLKCLLFMIPLSRGSPNTQGNGQDRKLGRAENQTLQLILQKRGNEQIIRFQSFWRAQSSIRPAHFQRVKHTLFCLRYCVINYSRVDGKRKQKWEYNSWHLYHIYCYWSEESNNKAKVYENINFC